MKKFLFFSFLFLFLFSCNSEKKNSNAEKMNKSVVSQSQTPFDLKLPSLDGEYYSLNDFKGKVVFLNFFATWCPYCRKEIPELVKLNKEIKNKNFVLIGIDIEERREKVKSFAEKYDINYKILLDSSGQLAQYFGIRGIPTSFILDKNQKIVFKGHTVPEIEKIKEILK